MSHKPSLDLELQLAGEMGLNEIAQLVLTYNPNQFTLGLIELSTFFHTTHTSEREAIGNIRASEKQLIPFN